MHGLSGATFVVALLFGVAANGGEAKDPLPAEVYARAEALLGPNLESKVLNGFVVPTWIGKTDRFWYRREIAGGHEYVLVDAATGRKRVVPESEVVPAPEPQPAAGLLPSPDGKQSLRVRDGNLHLVDATGAERALTTDGSPNAGYGIYPDNRADFVPRQRSGDPQPPVDTQWSPDGRTVLVPFIDQSKVPTYPFLESAPLDGSFRPIAYPVRIPLVGEHPATFEWRLIDFASGQQRRIELPYEKLLVIQQDMIAVRDSWWTKNSRHLYLAAHGDNMESAFLFEVDVATGASRTVVDDRVLPRTDLNSTSYNPINVRVVRDGRELIWFSQRDGWGHLYRYDIASGRLLNRITSGDWLVRDIIEVDEKRGVLYFTASGREPGNPYYRGIYRVKFDGSDLRLLSPEPADHPLAPNKRFVLSLEGVTPFKPVSPSGKYIAYTYSRVDQPPRFVVRRVADASLVAEIERADVTGLMAAGWRAPEEFTVKADDGKTDLWGVIYRPSDFDPQKRYPVIDAQYASPLTAVAPRNFFQAWRGRQPIAPSSYAELGFVVVSVDSRGTTYRSKDFLHHNYGRLNVNGLDDHVHVIRELVKTRPYMDVDRVGIVGHSYGGYSALRALLEFPDFFKVGISSAPMATGHGMYNDYHWNAFQGRPKYSDGSEWRPGPKEVPSNWTVLDATSQASRLKGKLLLQLGELDENAPAGQILQFASALIRENKDFEFMYLPSRDHQFLGESYVMRRDWDFMVRNLMGREPPAGYQIKVNRR